MGHGRIEVAPWMKWLIGLGIVLLLATTAMVIAILVIVADNDHHHHHHHSHHKDSSSSSEGDSDGICTKDFLKDLPGSKWEGNATILTKDGVFIGKEKVTFLREPPSDYKYHKQKLPPGAFYYLNKYESFDPKTGKLIASGSELFAGFIDIFPSGVCYISTAEVKPEADSYSLFRFLEDDVALFSIRESSDTELSLALRGKMHRVHY